MIGKIIELIMSLINLIITTILKIIMSLFPVIGLEQVSNLFNAFFGLLEGAVNMTYFIVGDSTKFFIDTAIVLLTLKHVVLPVVNFVRKVIIK